MHEFERCNDKIIKTPKQSQHRAKKLRIITHPSTIQTARNIHTHTSNLRTTVQPVHSFLPTTNLQLGDSLHTFNWPERLQRDHSWCDSPRIAMSHPHQPQHFARNPQRDQQHGFGWLLGVADVSKSSFEDFFQTSGCLFSSSWSILEFGTQSQHHHLDPLGYLHSHSGGRSEDVIQTWIAAATTYRCLGTSCIVCLLATIHNAKKHSVSIHHCQDYSSGSRFVI